MRCGIVDLAHSLGYRVVASYSGVRSLPPSWSAPSQHAIVNARSAMVRRWREL